MMHRAWSGIEEVPYCFSRSYVKLQGHTALKVVDFDPNWAFPDCNSSLESPMATKWCTKLEVALKRCPIVFQGYPSNFQGHIALKIIEFDWNWAFPDCNSSLNSLMGMKCCTKLETAKKRCPIVFQGHPSNFKVTRDKTSPIVTQIGRFRTIGRSQLSNPSDLPCSRSPIKFQGHTALKIVEFDPDWALRSVTPVWIHRWIWNDAQSLK